MTDGQLAAALVAANHPEEYRQALALVRTARRLLKLPTFRALAGVDRRED